VVDSTVYPSFQDLGQEFLDGGLDLARTEDVWESDVEILDWANCHKCSGRWYDALSFTSLVNLVERIVDQDLWHIAPTDEEPERYVVAMEPKKLQGESAVMRAKCLDGVWREVLLPRSLWFQETQPRKRCIGFDEDGREVHEVVEVTREYRKKGKTGFRNPDLWMDRLLNVDREALKAGKLKEIKFSFPQLCKERDLANLQEALKLLVQLAEQNGLRGDKYRLPILRFLAIDPNTGVVTNAASGVISAETRRHADIANERGAKDRFLDSSGEIPSYDGPKVDQLPTGKRSVIAHPEYMEDLLYPMLDSSREPVWLTGSFDVGNELAWVMPFQTKDGKDISYGPKRFLRGEKLDDGTWTGPRIKAEFLPALKEFIQRHEDTFVTSTFQASDPEGMIPGRRLIINPLITGDDEHAPAKRLRFERTKGGFAVVWVTSGGKLLMKHPDPVIRDRKPLTLYQAGHIWNPEWPVKGWLPDLLRMAPDHPKYEAGMEFLLKGGWLSKNNHVIPNVRWEWEGKPRQMAWVEYYIPLGIMDSVSLEELGIDRYKLDHVKNDYGEAQCRGVKVRVFGDHIKVVNQELKHGADPFKTVAIWLHSQKRFRIVHKTKDLELDRRVSRSKPDVYLPYREDMSKFIKSSDTPEVHSTMEETLTWIPWGHPARTPRLKVEKSIEPCTTIGDVLWKRWLKDHSLKG